MKRKLLVNLAVSGFVLSVATGCSGMGKMAEAAPQSPGTSASAAKSAEKAREALEAGKASKAVTMAEAAVAAAPRDAGYRALLGQAYLGDGRFASATTALSDAMELGAKDGNTIIALTLAHIAQGKNDVAADLLKRHFDAIPASDLGLALALAGDTNSAIYVLTEAARAENADARTRQNLALAFALSGRWAQARVLASQDLSLDKIEARMAEWSKLAEQPDARIRVASLIGTSAQNDAGMPVRLALGASDIQMAAADAPRARCLGPPPPRRPRAGRAGQRRTGAGRGLCAATARRVRTGRGARVGRAGDPHGRTADAEARRKWRRAGHRAAAAETGASRGDLGRRRALSRRSARCARTGSSPSGAEAGA